MRELRGLKTASPTELSQLTQTDPASTGKVIQTLIKKNWIKRTDHPEDRRKWLVALTPEGMRAAQSLLEVFQGLSAELCESLSARKKETLFQLLAGISSHFDKIFEATKDQI
ncbi:MarR family transcriptional regulator [Bdellovibrionota bacterium FG-1]